MIAAGAVLAAVLLLAFLNRLRAMPHARSGSFVSDDDDDYSLERRISSSEISDSGRPGNWYAEEAQRRIAAAKHAQLKEQLRKQLETDTWSAAESLAVQAAAVVHSAQAEQVSEERDAVVENEKQEPDVLSKAFLNGVATEKEAQEKADVSISQLQEAFTPAPPVDQLVPIPSTAQSTVATWDIFSILLAPLAPFAASFPSFSLNPKAEKNKYDMFVDFLEATAQTLVPLSPLHAFVNAIPPTGAPSRYDCIHDLIQSLVKYDPEVEENTAYDMVWDVLHSHTGSAAPSGAERYDPVGQLLKEAVMAEDWGPLSTSNTDSWGKYDPVHHLRAVITSVEAPTVRSKYDPITELRKWSSVTSSSLSASTHAGTPDRWLSDEKNSTIQQRYFDRIQLTDHLGKVRDEDFQRELVLANDMTSSTQ